MSLFHGCALTIQTRLASRSKDTSRFKPSKNHSQWLVQRISSPTHKQAVKQKLSRCSVTQEKTTNQPTTPKQFLQSCLGCFFTTGR